MTGVCGGETPHGPCRRRVKGGPCSYHGGAEAPEVFVPAPRCRCSPPIVQRPDGPGELTRCFRCAKPIAFERGAELNASTGLDEAEVGELIEAAP